MFPYCSRPHPLRQPDFGVEVVVNMVGPSGRSPKFSGITDTHMLLLGIPLDLGRPALFIASFAVCLPSNPAKHPHYTFVFLDGYVGWVEVIFNDPQAASLAWRNSAYEIDVPEPGVPTTLCA